MSLRRLKAGAAALPWVRGWRLRRFEARFAAGQAVGCCRGVYATHAEAAAAAPPTRPLGYDHAEGGQMYRDRLGQLYVSDYPVIAWLHKALSEGGHRVFDLGGHIGLAYYNYQRLLDFPADLRWQVHDVPSVMTAGAEEARRRDGAGRLGFAEDFAAAADADILFTAGCLQYLEQTLAHRLQALPRRPRWLLVNLLPLHERHEFWTVQSIGTAYCPYRIQQRATFFADLHALGYATEAAWDNLDKDCWVAYEPDYSLDRYAGAALRLRD